MGVSPRLSLYKLKGRSDFSVIDQNLDQIEFFLCLHTFGSGVGVGLASPSSFFMVLPPSLPELSTHQKPGNEAKSCAVVGMAKRFSAAFQRYPTCRASSLRCQTTPLFLEQTDMAMETTVCGLCSVFSDCPK